MCSRLKLENTGHKAGQHQVAPPKTDKVIGMSVPVKLTDGKVVDAIWNGHAREEGLDIWIAKGWQECRIVASTYTEGHPGVEYTVPAGQYIKGVTRQVIINNKTQVIVNIVTREATPTERLIHPRFPRLVS